MQPNGVTALADIALRGADLGKPKAQQAQRQAEEPVQNPGSQIDYAKAQRFFGSSNQQGSLRAAFFSFSSPPAAALNEPVSQKKPDTQVSGFLLSEQY